MDIRNVALLALVLDILFNRELREEVFRFLGIAFRGGNRWGRQWVTLPVILWLGLLYAFAAWGFSTNFLLLLWLVPAVLLAVAVAWWPAVTAAIWTIYSGSGGRLHAVITNTMVTAGWIMAVGLALVATPVANDPFLVAVIGGIALFATLWNAGQSSVWPARIKRAGTALAILAIFTMLAVLFLGGRHAVAVRAQAGWSAISSTLKSQASAPPSASGIPARATTSAAPTTVDLTVGCGDDYTSALQDAYDQGARRVRVTLEGRGCLSLIFVRPWKPAERSIWDGTQRTRSNDFAHTLSCAVMVRNKAEDGKEDAYADAPGKDVVMPWNSSERRFWVPEGTPAGSCRVTFSL